MQASDQFELLFYQPVKRKDLTIVGMPGKCQIDTGFYRRIPSQWSVIEKHFESLRIKCDVREFATNLMNIIGIIYTDQLQAVDVHTVISKHLHAGFLE